MSDVVSQIRPVRRSAGSSVRWDWYFPGGTVRCGASSDRAFARAIAGVDSFEGWIARVAPVDRACVEAGLRACLARADGHWRASYALCVGEEAPLPVVHEVFAVELDGGRRHLVGSVAPAAATMTTAGAGPGACDLANMFDVAGDAVLICDMRQRVLYWNRAASGLYGWRAAEVLGRPLREHVCKDIPEPEFAAAVRTLMRHGDFTGRMTHRRRDGDALAMHTRWIVVRNSLGLPCLTLLISSDVRERAELYEQMAQAQKLEALGALAGGIAHDFNNLLTVIIGNADELAEALHGRRELAELALMIQSAGQRGAELTQRLLAFARSQALAPELIDIGTVLQAIEPMLRRSLPENIKLAVDVEKDACTVFVDRGQLETSLLNLCINARNAMPSGGALAIHVAMALAGSDTAALAGCVEGGPCIAISVSDNGSGIPADILPLVFDPFFTTKPGGSGLGLSMVQGFARQSGGRATIWSEPGRGTVVTLYLPCADGKPVAAARPGPAAQHHVRSVLLVEDDASLRAHVHVLLEAMGHTVTASASAEEALRLLEAGLHVEVLLADIGLPGMSGIDLANEVRRRWPGLRILLSTGYSPESFGGAHALPAGDVLHKPYGKADLRRALDRV
ncbi:PAS domain S-box-containing protein [Massilia sp. UYP11]|uniref:ATP-binding protein n=1 Tax=Massilia sp. UYP11 TaxID=1756385 RepID=UPI003D1AED3D